MTEQSDKPSVDSGMTYVCPEKDIVCGSVPWPWCLKCPKRAALAGPLEQPQESTEAESLIACLEDDASQIRNDCGNVGENFVAIEWADTMEDAAKMLRKLTEQPIAEQPKSDKANLMVPVGSDLPPATAKAGA